jgi:hypothetical protein
LFWTSAAACAIEALSISPKLIAQIWHLTNTHSVRHVRLRDRLAAELEKLPKRWKFYVRLGSVA